MLHSDRGLVTACLEAGISPEYFITEESRSILSLYTRFKRYGITGLTSKPEDLPELFYQAFDAISAELDRINAKATNKLRAGEKK